jgi:hypothetical protein
MESHLRNIIFTVTELKLTSHIKFSVPKIVVGKKQFGRFVKLDSAREAKRIEGTEEGDICLTNIRNQPNNENER